MEQEHLKSKTKNTTGTMILALGKCFLLGFGCLGAPLALGLGMEELCLRDNLVTSAKSVGNPLLW